MTRIDDLGVSRMPWELMDDGLTVVTKLDDGVYGEVAGCREARDARLIAAAPELYEALRAIVSLYEDCSRNPFCEDCPRCVGKDRCDKEEKALVELAKSALAKACGEEAK